MMQYDASIRCDSSWGTVKCCQGLAWVIGELVTQHAAPQAAPVLQAESSRGTWSSGHKQVPEVAATPQASPCVGYGGCTSPGHQSSHGCPEWQRQWGPHIA